jgi:hypothetical protein
MNGIVNFLRKNDGWTFRVLISIGLDQHHARRAQMDRQGWRFAALLASGHD